MKISQKDQKQIKSEKVPGKDESDKFKPGAFVSLSAMSKNEKSVEAATGGVLKEKVLLEIS